MSHGGERQKTKSMFYAPSAKRSMFRKRRQDSKILGLEKDQSMLLVLCSMLRKV